MTRARRCGGVTTRLCVAALITGATDMDDSIIIIADEEILIAPLADDEDLPEDEDPLSRLNLSPEDIPY
jgi:hypothetical protein